LKDIELMETVVKEQCNRKWNGFILITRFYTMNKYSKTELATFKAKWAEDNVQELIKEEDAILKDTNEEIRNLFYLMKRKCGDYLYRANLVWESLVNSRTQNTDSWFSQYTKVSRDFHNENWENCFICARDSIYMMRNGNFRNNQVLMDLYIMGTEAMINSDNIDVSFINEGLTIGIEIPGLAVRKLF
jgi:hypothetical protein